MFFIGIYKLACGLLLYTIYFFLFFITLYILYISYYVYVTFSLNIVERSHDIWVQAFGLS